MRGLSSGIVIPDESPSDGSGSPELSELSLLSNWSFSSGKHVNQSVESVEDELLIHLGLLKRFQASLKDQ